MKLFYWKIKKSIFFSLNDFLNPRLYKIFTGMIIHASEIDIEQKEKQTNLTIVKNLNFVN